MKSETLNRSKNEYLHCAISIILSGVIIIKTCDATLFENPVKAFFFWCALAVFALYTIQIFTVLRFPILSVSGGKLCFFPIRSMHFKRVCLAVGDIDCIVEARRKTGGVSKLIDLPTFLVSMKDGSTFEYFPGLPPGGKLDDIRGLISRAASLHGIELQRDGQRVLDDCRKQSKDIMIYLFSAFILVALLSALTVQLG